MLGLKRESRSIANRPAGVVVIKVRALGRATNSDVHDAEQLRLALQVWEGQGTINAAVAERMTSFTLHRTL